MNRLLLKIPGSENTGHHHMDLTYGRERDILPLDNYLMFSVIRDPREILVTQIAHVIHNQTIAVEVSKPQATREEIIAKYLNAVKQPFYRHAHYVDYVIRYARLEDDLWKLLKWLGVKRFTLDHLPTIGITPGKKQWFKYFTREQLDWMDVNIKEIETYHFKEWE